MKKKRTRILVLTLVCLIPVFIVVLSFNQVGANAVFDKGVDKFCSSVAGKNIKPDDTGSARLNIEEKTGIPYPSGGGTVSFSIDLDTYASTWKASDTSLDDPIPPTEDDTPIVDDKDKYPKDKKYQEVTTEGNSYLSYDLESARLSIKDKLPQITSEIEKIYGKPFKSQKVTVIFSYFGDDLFRYGMQNATGQYDAGLNAIYLTKQSLAETSPGSGVYKTVIHEIVHAYNDGTLGVESYEEGMVEATAQIVASKLDGNYSFSYGDFSNRDILKNIAGLYRTQEDSQLTNQRYEASAKFFYDQYNSNDRFIKDFRTKYKKSTYYRSFAVDPYLAMQSIVTRTMCNEISGYTSELAKYIKNTQNLLVDGLGSRTNSVDKLFEIKSMISKYPTIDALPPTLLYPQQGTLYTDVTFDQAGDLDIRSTYKITTIQDAIPAIYRYLFNEKPERYYNISSELPKLATKISESSTFTSLSLQNLSYVLEQNADKIDISIYTDDQKELAKETVEISYDDLKYGPAVSYNIYQLLSSKGVAGYQGKLYVSVNASKTVDRGVRDKGCIKFIIGKTCYTAGLRVSEQVLKSSVNKTLEVKDGVISNYTVVKPQTNKSQ